MNNSAEVINNLLLDLSLVSALPVGLEGRNFIKATSSTSALVSRTLQMKPHELKDLEYTLGPLLTLLITDLNNPVAEKAAYGIRTLMPSRICMGSFLDMDGLNVVGRVFDAHLGGNPINLIAPSIERNTIEHLTAVYREVGRYYPWKVTQVGAVRHLVIILRKGDMQLKSLALSTLASLSVDANICKLMFSNGAIKPLLMSSDWSTGHNEACTLAGLGCIVQMCRIPAIATQIIKQGALNLLERALHYTGGNNVKGIREKALYALAWISKSPDVHSKMCTPVVFSGMKRELVSGTMPARYTILQMLLNLHLCYKQEKDFVRTIFNEVMELLFVGPWHARNLVIKCICILYRSKEDCMTLVNMGVLEAIFGVIQSKNMDLVEAPLVAILSFTTHPEIPRILIAKGGHHIIANLLYAVDEVIRDMAVIILKVLVLYDKEVVEAAIAHDRMPLMNRKPDPDYVGVYGSEFGGMIEDFLQEIVENRRDEHYLLEKLTPEEIEGVDPEMLESYQNTFMELDVECLGFLGADEFKVLLIMMGEKMDKEEMEELLKEYDEDGSGYLDFSEFVKMMQGWTKRFGEKGSLEYYQKQIMERGVIGKAKKAFNFWWDTNNRDKAEIAAVKAKKKAAEEERKRLAAEHWEAEKIRLAREQESKLRAQQENGGYDYEYDDDDEDD